MQYRTTSFGPIWLDNLYYCYSSTTDLRNCTRAVGVHNCNHGEDVTLTCSGKIKFCASFYQFVLCYANSQRAIYGYTNDCQRWWALYICVPDLRIPSIHSGVL